MGKQGYNEQSNIGFGGIFRINSDFIYQPLHFKIALKSGMWTWRSYNEYLLGVAFIKSLELSKMKKLGYISAACIFNQINDMKILSFSLGATIFLNRTMIGCD
jgi:hypothetical protein